jgi:hypothetical protein
MRRGSVTPAGEHVIRRYAHQFALLVVAALGCWWLLTQFGPLVSGAMWVAFALLACGMGVLLLRTSEVGRVTWRNRVAAYLVPWGVRIGGGKLWPIPVVSWLTWLSVWAAVALLTPPPADEPPTGWEVAARVALGVAWLIDGVALGYVVGTLPQCFPSGSGGRSLRVIAAVITGLIVASVACHLFGLTAAGLLVAGGPPLLVGVGYGLFLAVLLVFGRNTRWN